MTETLSYIALVLIGCIAGFLNVTAGGGSLLTLPFLIFMGLSPAMANGTNRIAILLQNISATARFHHFEVIPKGIILVTSIPAALGAILGAQIAVEIDEMLFKRLLAVVMVMVMGFTFFKPGLTKPEVKPQFSTYKKIVLAGIFFLIGIYGGFIQGGIGFILISVLSLAGYDLVRVNALKVLIVLIFIPFALTVFIINGQVDFIRGMILACGNATGAWLATKVVVKKGHKFIRWFVLAAVTGFAIKLMFG